MVTTISLMTSLRQEARKQDSGSGVVHQGMLATRPCSFFQNSLNHTFKICELFMFYLNTNRTNTNFGSKTAVFLKYMILSQRFFHVFFQTLSVVFFHVVNSYLHFKTWLANSFFCLFLNYPIMSYGFLYKLSQ